MEKRGVKLFVWLNRACALMLLLLALAACASAQTRIPVERVGGRLVNLKLDEITLESIDFRDQTARLNLALDVSNGLVPVKLKDFDYRLRLSDQDIIEGFHDGTLRIGGRQSSRVNLPVVVNLRSIPGVVWSAFRNRGQVRYQLDAAFTLPLFVMERRFDQSLAGEVPLRTLVDAASILRASRMTDAGRGIWGF